MPDDQTAWVKARGAVPVTIRAPLDGARIQRHAAHRLPAEHPEAHRLDQLHAGGHLDARLYANACAALRLWMDAGLGRSRGIADYVRTEIGAVAGEARGPEDDLRDLIESGGVEFQAVLMLVRGDDMGTHMWGRAVKGLDRLDMLAARFDGEMWRSE